MQSHKIKLNGFTKSPTNKPGLYLLSSTCMVSAADRLLLVQPSQTLLKAGEVSGPSYIEPGTKNFIQFYFRPADKDWEEKVDSIASVYIEEGRVIL